MADKIEDFKRINEPRVNRALEQLGHVEKSAASMRIDDNDLRRLLVPLDDKIADLFGDPGQENEPSEVSEHVVPDLEKKMVAAYEALPDATPPVAREMELLQNLSTQQLVDRMIACGAELAKRRQ